MPTKKPYPSDLTDAEWKLLEPLLEAQGLAWPDNIVAVTSVTSQKTAKRIDLLREVPAKFRAISVEPLWEKVDLNLDGIDWCIVGGQSGWYRNRPFEVDWARHLRDQCRIAGTSFFLNQLWECSDGARRSAAVEVSDGRRLG